MEKMGILIGMTVAAFIFLLLTVATLTAVLSKLREANSENSKLKNNIRKLTEQENKYKDYPRTGGLSPDTGPRN